MKKIFCIITIFAVIGFFAAFSSAQALNQDNSASDQGPALSGVIENGVRVVQVTAMRYKFEPDPIVVKLGEKVRIIATTKDVTHGLSIFAFNVNLIIKPGKTNTVEFVADKEGTFNTECSVFCGSGHEDMRGTLNVVK